MGNLLRFGRESRADVQVEVLLPILGLGVVLVVKLRGFGLLGTGAEVGNITHIIGVIILESLRLGLH